MTFHVVDAEEGLAGGGGEAFSVSEADEKRGREAGTAGGGEGGDVIEGDSGVIECLLNERTNMLGVIAAGNFGDNAAVFAMDLDLRRDERSEELGCVALAANNGDGGFVAGGFDGEDHSGGRGDFLKSEGSEGQDRADDPKGGRNQNKDEKVVHKRNDGKGS